MVFKIEFCALLMVAIDLLSSIASSANFNISNKYLGWDLVNSCNAIVSFCVFCTAVAIAVIRWGIFGAIERMGNNMKYLLKIIISICFLAGCTTQADRLAKCQNLGVSIDTCYAKDMDRETSMRNIYQAQALRNSAKALEDSEYKHHHHY